jgi:hypothetical protein
MEADGGDWYETADDWYEAAEEAPAPDPVRNAARLAFQHATEEEAGTIHHREMAKLNAAIEGRLTEMTRESMEHEASARAVSAVQVTLSGGRTNSSPRWLPAVSSICPRPSGAPTRRVRRISASRRS